MEVLWTIAALTIIALAGAGLLKRHGLEPFGMYRVNDFTVEKVRHAVIEACKGAQITGLSRDKAQHLLSELARHAVAKAFSEIYVGRPFKVTESWPAATVIISGNIAVIDLWLGHDYMDDGEGVKPINVEISRQPALKLDGKRPIKVALGEMYEPPAKAVASAGKTARKVPDAPTQKPGAKDLRK